MLRESPQQRPNIYQVVAETCAMRHRACPIKDVGNMALWMERELTSIRFTLAARNLKHDGTSNYRQQNPKFPHHHR